jgi:transcriptional regulator with XRE-family HTH domain
MIGESPADQPAPNFALLLKQLRAEARLTQEELAHAAGLSPRSISDLERGISRTARKDTALLLANALAIEGSARAKFVEAARGKADACEVLAARDALPARLPTVAIRCYPRTADLPLPYDVEVGNFIDAITAANVSNRTTITGIWLISLAAQPDTEARRGPGAQTIAVRDSVGGTVWRNAPALTTVRSDPEAAFGRRGRCRHAHSRRGTR